MTETPECILEKANQIMDSAIEKAGDLIMTKPNIAEIILKQVLKCDPENNSALQLLGLCKHRMGENAEAIEIIRMVLDLDPDNADNWNNIGLAYGGLGNSKKSIECINMAIKLNPNQYFFKNNLSLQYRALGDYDNAILYMRKAIESNEQPQLWLNLGGIYGELKNIHEAKKCFENALKIDPKYPAAHVDMAFTYHLFGDWKKGFAAYEWRFWYYPQMRYYHNAYDMNKLWNGKDDLNGKRVLVYGEQGLGDIIQFVRYAKDLKQLGAHVIIHCPNSLDSVVKRIEGVDETTNRDIVNDNGDKFPDYDYQFSMMSFPHLLDSQEIYGKPYIKPVTMGFSDHMKKEYGDTLNIGIVWAGSPAHPHDKKRSIQLKFFKPLQDVSGVKLFSLQMEGSKRKYGVTYRNEKENLTDPKDMNFEKFQPDAEGIVDYNEGCGDMNIIDLTKMIQSFEDTATILAGIDILICCDTSIAHMAGAMGVPVWNVIPYNPDWRWTLEGETTKWYDSMRIYRQEKKDDWTEVFKKIEKDLRENILQNK